MARDEAARFDRRAEAADLESPISQKRDPRAWARWVLYCWSMDKRLAKRHKRQVARAKLHSKTSQPDVRTHEQIEAAREASRPDLSRDGKPKPAGTSR